MGDSTISCTLGDCHFLRLVSVDGTFGASTVDVSSVVVGALLMKSEAVESCKEDDNEGC